MSGQAFLSETRERFLKAILAELPLERVREMYLFPPIKQGGVESGVAVVAGYPEAPAVADDTGDPTSPPAADDEPVESPPPAPAVDDADATSGDTAEGEGEGEPAVIEAEAEPEVVEAEVVDGEVVVEGEGCETPAAEDAVPAPEAPAPVAEKYTVYSARYRHVLKGPDRGKWEASLVAEAEAPLLSIESVVRGVQRRAGDVEGPDHMTAADIRAALRLGPAPTSDAA